VGVIGGFGKRKKKGFVPRPVEKGQEEEAKIVRKQDQNGQRGKKSNDLEKGLSKKKEAKKKSIEDATTKPLNYGSNGHEGKGDTKGGEKVKSLKLTWEENVGKVATYAQRKSKVSGLLKRK